MGAASDYLELKLLDHMLKNSSYTSPTSIWIGKFAAENIADPEEAQQFAMTLIKRGEHWLYLAIAVLVLVVFIHWLWNRRSDQKASISSTRDPGAPRGGGSGLLAGGSGSAAGTPDSR